jgi:hypothetical protein
MSDKKQKASNEKIREAQARKKQFDEEHEGAASEIDVSEWLEENREQIRRETEGMTPAERREHRREKIREAGFEELWPEEKLQKAFE